MKTTMNIDEELMNEAMKIYGVKTKTQVVEMGLRSLIDAYKRKQLIELFGKEKNIKAPIRRRLS